MENFTPYSALAGGIMIGLSVTIMLLFNGRITGISSMLSELLSPSSGEWPWRLVFIMGMMLGTLFYITVFSEPLIAQRDLPFSLLIIAGFLVGFGTRLGNGCTSGHGICGIARRSPRSIIATMVFMTSGGITVFIMRHIVGMPS